MKALIVDEPWISMILDGEKTREMRSTHTAIALIRKGSGSVVGLANVVDSVGPLDSIAWRAHRGRHRIPLNRYEETLRWDTAWVLDDVRPLTTPVAYSHPSGAVIWVNLEEDVAVALQVAPTGLLLHKTGSTPVAAPRRTSASAAAVDMTPAVGDVLVPVARDGSWFSPALEREGGYTVGAKGSEFVVRDYSDALARLRLMDVPRWRRPNAKGNWGIVAGVEWQAGFRLHMH